MSRRSNAALASAAVIVLALALAACGEEPAVGSTEWSTACVWADELRWAHYGGDNSQWDAAAHGFRTAGYSRLADDADSEARAIDTGDSARATQTVTRFGSDLLKTNLNSCPR